MFKDYYLILGIGRDASSSDIEKAYKESVSKFNDYTSSARYQEVQEAFEILSHQETKILYDNELLYFKSSDGFANYKIKDQKLESVINSLQGNTKESEKNTDCISVLIDEGEKLFSCAGSKSKVEDKNRSTIVEQGESSKKSSAELPINNSKGMFRRLLTPRGRIRRTEFFISCFCYLIVYFLLSVMIHIAYETDRAMLIYLKVIDVLFFVLFVFQCIKRCHDWGHSGWFILIPFMIIFLIFAEGDDDVNSFGTNPKVDYDLQV